jgi:hypothetical protein
MPVVASLKWMFFCYIGLFNTWNIMIEFKPVQFFHRPQNVAHPGLVFWRAVLDRRLFVVLTH